MKTPSFIRLNNVKWKFQLLKRDETESNVYRISIFGTHTHIVHQHIWCMSSQNANEYGGWPHHIRQCLLWIFCLKKCSCHSSKMRCLVFKRYLFDLFYGNHFHNERCTKIFGQGDQSSCSQRVPTWVQIFMKLVVMQAVPSKIYLFMCL